jgi:hypothetical protein
VRSGSFHRQNVQGLVGLSCMRELHECIVPSRSSSSTVCDSQMVELLGESEDIYIEHSFGTFGMRKRESNDQATCNSNLFFFPVDKSTRRPSIRSPSCIW